VLFRRRAGGAAAARLCRAGQPDDADSGAAREVRRADLRRQGAPSRAIAAQKTIAAASPPSPPADRRRTQPCTRPPIGPQSSLTEAGWDPERAYDLLRKKGLAAAAKKASRHAAEGLVGVASAPGAVAIVEINSETDFVARNEMFTGLVAAIARAALALPPSAAAGGGGGGGASGAPGGSGAISEEALAGARLEDGRTAAEAVTAVAAQARRAPPACARTRAEERGGRAPCGSAPPRSLSCFLPPLLSSPPPPTTAPPACLFPSLRPL